MRVSIVTPVYNDTRIRHTLESIFFQEGVSDTEVIVVDGNSTDSTPAILAEYSDDIDILIQEPDEGIYDAMNKGIRRASGDIIGILNADDRYNGPDVLRSVVDRFETNELELCYGDLVYVDDDDTVVRYWKTGRHRTRKIYFGWIPPHPSVFVRSSVYDRYGLFDTEFSIAADYEFLLRLFLCHQVSAAYIDKVLIRMSTGGRSNRTLTNILRANIEVRRAWRKNGLRGGVHVPFIKPLRKIPQFVRSCRKR